MNKFLALLIATAMVLGLTACGGSSPASAVSSAEPPSAPTEAPAPEAFPEAPSEAASEPSTAEEISVVEETPEPEISNDDVILGENSVKTGDTLELSVNAEGLSPMFTAVTDSSLSSTGNIGKNTYYAAAYVTENGIQEGSNPNLAEEGTITDTEATDVVIRNSASGANGFLISNAPYSIKNADIQLNSIDNGLNTSDFIGKGTGIMATGDYANVTVEDSIVDVTGTARLAAFVDSGAAMTVRHSTLISRGGTMFESYRNTASISSMISPPWVLGIMGNSRCTNLMGTNSTLNLVDSDAQVGAWAGLSTDAGTNVHLNVYDSSITILKQDESLIPFQAYGGQVEALDNPYTTRFGSGYGAYSIGAAVETYRGATIQVGTMANIFTGGTATYGALKAGETYTLESGSGNADIEYTATEDKNTVIESDTQGFMIHQNTNTLNVLEGTVVNSAYTGVLMKTGSSSASVNATFADSQLNAGNGVLVQLIDNDDALLGGMDSSGGFYETYHETPGFLTAPEASDGSTASETADMGPGSVPSTGSETATFTFSNMELQGNMYNAGGWYGGLTGIPMNIALEDTTLNGAIATTTAIHVSYDGAVAYANRDGVAFDDDDEAAAFADKYQATEFSISEYWTIGQVANKIAYSNSNVINVAMSGDSVWNVESSSMINSLTLSDNAKVVVPADVSLMINGTEYTDCVIDEAGVYGTVVEASEATASAGGMGGPGGPGGPPPGGPGGPPPGMGGEGYAAEETGPVYTYIWSVDSTDAATIHDNEDGTVTVTAAAPGEVKVRLDLVIDGISAGQFVKIITVD